MLNSGESQWEICERRKNVLKIVNMQLTFIRGSPTVTNLSLAAI